MSEKNIYKGILWSGLEKFSVQIFQFIISIILARLLSPQDFGTIALVLIIMNIIQAINEGGFAEALMNKLDRDDLDYSTVFYFNLLLGIILYLLIYISAPFIATFFNIYELVFLIRLLGLNIIITSFVIVQRTILIINVDFKTQAKASFIGIIIGGIIGIYLAYKGFKSSSIVIQYLTTNIITTIILWKISMWKPCLGFSIVRLKILFNYAYKLILARLVNVVFSEIYTITIGKFYNPVQLGFFNRSKSFIAISSNNITSIIQRVSTPVLCKYQFDNLKMGDSLIKFIVKTSMLVFPLLFGIFVLSDSFIYVILGDKWMESSWILRVLCPVGVLYVFSTFNMNIFNATARTDLALKSELQKKIINILIILIAVSISFEFLIYSQIIIAVIEFFINTWYTKKQIGLDWKVQVLKVYPIFLSSFIMAVIIYLSIIFIYNDYLKLVIGVIVGLVSYILICYIFNINNFKYNLNNIAIFKHYR